MATAERRAEVAWQGNLMNGSGAFDLASSGAMTGAQVSFATRTENPDGNTSPEELIAAAHASCYTMALSNTLGEQGNDPEELNVTATCTLDIGSLKITTMVLDIRETYPASTRRASGAPPNRRSRPARSPTPCAPTWTSS